MYVCGHVSPLTELYIMVQDKHPFIFFRTTLEMKKMLLFPIYERYYIDPIKSNDFLLIAITTNNASQIFQFQKYPKIFLKIFPCSLMIVTLYLPSDFFWLKTTCLIYI